ncbi:cytochrome c biogenesis heme-transporting ATPase CcmA [Planctobacterium marinum]|uniref:cytochrome c biogenesis heme-transporting ATPase CcmA n=1 Tax=Planctobacterium marinum TaxID=1631968 RepID=UPI001E3D518D|nr:cytochrome c biogenesis heme-transporting ATPase CcmA [Planctobacterium marinum]MCC2606175.1 cytochrome c biogenesis heme-transporting ATPase CcmA [Planctobacterium marinum]
MDRLTVSDLQCIKQDRELFSQLSFQVCSREAWHIVGDNGAGKTSLLRIVAGLSQAQQGAVHWNDEPISQCTQDYNRSLLYLGHKLALNQHLSAIENLKFWAGVQQLAETIDPYPLLATLGLAGLEDIPVANLSAGQQRRVSLCRIWMKKASLLILDEPFNALDVDSRALLENKLRQHISEGGMLLFTSHWQLASDIKIKELRLEYQL